MTRIKKLANNRFSVWIVLGIQFKCTFYQNEKLYTKFIWLAVCHLIWSLFTQSTISIFKKKPQNRKYIVFLFIHPLTNIHPIHDKTKSLALFCPTDVPPMTLRICTFIFPWNSNHIMFFFLFCFFNPLHHESFPLYDQESINHVASPHRKRA